MLSLEADYFGIEGSPTVVATLRDRYPSLKEKILLGDYTQAIPFNYAFDLVIDRSSLTCTDSKSIEQCMELVAPRLRKGGKFIGVDWFSREHSEYLLGRDTDDEYTKT